MSSQTDRLGGHMEIHRRRGLPGGRAVLGGVLIAVAVVGVFVAYEQAGRRADDPIVIAARAIRVGEVVARSDVRTVDGELPDGPARASFDRVESVVGRVALGPIAEGDILQSASLTEDAAAADVHEVAITLPRQQVAVGRLKEGERVDVFVTYDERTSSVVRGAQVVQIAAEDDASLTSEREIALVVAVPSGDAVAALVHALRTGDVTVVRSTFADASVDDPITYEGGGAAPDASNDGQPSG